MNTHAGVRSLVKKIFRPEHGYDSNNELSAFEALIAQPSFNQFTKNINGFFTIFNYRSIQYEFVSESITAHLGYHPAEFLGQEGAQRLYAIIEESHAALFIHTILKNVLNHLTKNATSGTGLDYRFNCALKLENVRHEFQWYIIDTVVIQTEETGLPWRTLITCTNIEQYKTDDQVYYNLMKKDASGMYQIIFEEYPKSEIRENKEQLTLRETEVLSMVAQGLTSKQIGEKLYISPATVKAHRRNILSKANCKGAAGLMNFAFSRGLV